MGLNGSEEGEDGGAGLGQERDFGGSGGEYPEGVGGEGEELHAGKFGEQRRLVHVGGCGGVKGVYVGCLLERRLMGWLLQVDLRKEGEIGMSGWILDRNVTEGLNG